MKNLILAVLLIAFFNGKCRTEQTKSSDVYRNTDLLGFVFINIGNIYHNGGETVLFDIKRDTVAYFRNTKLLAEGREYEIIEEEHLYKKPNYAEVFNPEYGLFILRCYGKEDGFYHVKFNNESSLIQINSSNVKFKNLEQYVLETSPIPTKENPIRSERNESSNIVSNYSDYTYLPIEINGDWLKVKDDKDCYIGAFPSKIDITGWVRWRRDGEFILKVAHTC